MDTKPPPIRILYLEDNPTDAALARRALTKLAPEYQLETVATLAAALAFLERPEPACDLVLTDLLLPDGSGIDLLAWIRTRRLPLSVVLITSSGDQNSAVAALKAGADDYLIKHGDYLAHLPETLHRAIAHFDRVGDGRTRALRVLYAEDNPLDIDLTRRHLEHYAPHIELSVEQSGAGLLSRFPKDSTGPPLWDVLLLDYRLPDTDALDLIRTLREEYRVDLPVILVSGQSNEEVVADAMRLGVEDYLVKHNSYLFELPSTLERAHRQAQLREEHATLLASNKQLRLLEERFHTIFDQAIDGILIADIATRRFVSANPAICRMLGYSQEELSRMGVEQIHPEEDLPWIAALFARQVEGQGIFTPDMPLRRKDGSILYADLNPSTVELDSKPCLMGIFRDSTERHRAEDRLRLDAAALAASRDAVVITDLQPVILGVNPAFTEITGYREEEVLGKNPKLLASGRQDRSFYQVMWASLLKEGSWQGEIWNRRKNGEAFPELLSISTVYDKQGKPSRYVAVATDLAMLRQSEERIRHLAHYDPLTKLPNRLLFEARLQHSLEHAARSHTGVAVLAIDLDQFKAVNDSLGHAEGDQLLVAVTERLLGRLRKEDTLARMTGDEFALAMELNNHGQDAEVTARIIESALAAPFILADGYEVYVQVSIGISLFPQDGTDAASLLSSADAAVHRAKEQGGNQFCYYDAVFNTRARTNLATEAALRRALDQGELLLYYQPKVNLRHGRIVGAEALIRWNRPGFGLVPPIDFIPIAERSSLIKAIGSWVIEEACRQIREWRQAELGEIHLAVNVSARQFHGLNLEKTLTGVLAHYGVAPGHLTLELTESILMNEPEQANSRLLSLKELGVRLSLDDFGTGYSSLAYLNQFPIDQMKIDCSFVREIVSDPGSATIATSIIGLAHRMGLTVVAEGVETEGQLGYLRQNGCDEIQGYLFSKPLPAEDFATMLRQGKSLSLPEDSPHTRTLLVVDDEPNILSALRRVFADEGYRLLTAGSAAEGLELLAKNAVQVVMADQRMPQMTGIEFLNRVKSLHPYTVRLVLSGYADLETVVRAVNEGGLYKFLAKPWNDEQLRNIVLDAFLYQEAVVRPRGAGDGVRIALPAVGEP